MQLQSTAGTASTCQICVTASALKSLKLVAEQRYEEDCYKLEAEHLPDVYLSHTSKLRHTELVKKPLSGSGLPSHHRGCMQTIVTCCGVRPWRAL